MSGIFSVLTGTSRNDEDQDDMDWDSDDDMDWEDFSWFFDKTLYKISELRYSSDRVTDWKIRVRFVDFHFRTIVEVSLP